MPGVASKRKSRPSFYGRDAVGDAVGEEVIFCGA